jgi:hypothetical protein
MESSLEPNGVRTTVITPTTGTPWLSEAIRSVQAQDKPCKHLVVIDGREYAVKAERILGDLDFMGDVIVLPENTGRMYQGVPSWNGHRIYSAIPKLVNTEYVSFLDEDNWYEPHFVRTVETIAEEGEWDVVTCRRHLWHDGTHLGVDDFESVGKNRFGYILWDTNTLFFRTFVYCQSLATGFFNSREADRKVSELIMRTIGKHRDLQQPLVNYRVRAKLLPFFLPNLRAREG